MLLNFDSIPCDACGINIELLPQVASFDTKDGWYRLFADVKVMIPEGAIIPTCYNCGDTYSYPNFEQVNFNKGKTLQDIVYDSLKETLKDKKIKEESSRKFFSFSCFCTMEQNLGTVDLVPSKGLIKGIKDNDWFRIFANVEMVIPKEVLIPKCNLNCDQYYYNLPSVRNNIYNSCLNRLQKLIENYERFLQYEISKTNVEAVEKNHGKCS